MIGKECMKKETITKIPIINKMNTIIEGMDMIKTDIIMTKEVNIKIAKIIIMMTTIIKDVAAIMLEGILIIILVILVTITEILTVLEVTEDTIEKIIMVTRITTIIIAMTTQGIIKTTEKGAVITIIRIQMSSTGAIQATIITVRIINMEGTTLPTIATEALLTMYKMVINIEFFLIRIK